MAAGSFVIRPAQERDTPQWLRMRHWLWPECPPERHQLEINELLNRPGLVIVAENEEGQLTGFAELSIRSDHVSGTSCSPVPYLEGWFVIEGARGKGIGRALIRHLEQWCLEQGFKELASDAELWNEHSIALHKHLGFVEVERTVQFLKQL